MKVSSFIYLKSIFAITFLLSSCGYELRTYSNSLDNQAIQLVASDSTLNIELENQLRLGRNLITSQNSKSAISIKVLQHDIKRFVGSSGSGARTTQVRLDYKIIYTVEINSKAQKEYLFEDTRYIDFNQSDLLAFEAEEEISTQDFIGKSIRNMEFILSSLLNETK